MGQKNNLSLSASDQRYFGFPFRYRAVFSRGVFKSYEYAGRNFQGCIRLHIHHHSGNGDHGGAEPFLCAVPQPWGYQDAFAFFAVFQYIERSLGHLFCEMDGKRREGSGMRYDSLSVDRINYMQCLHHKGQGIVPDEKGGQSH